MDWEKELGKKIKEIYEDMLMAPGDEISEDDSDEEEEMKKEVNDDKES